MSALGAQIGPQRPKVLTSKSDFLSNYARNLGGRKNRTLIGLLRVFSKGTQPEDWDLSLGDALIAYRVTVQTSTGVSPLKMLTSCGIRVSSDIFLSGTEMATNSAPEYLSYLKRDTYGCPISYRGSITTDTAGVTSTAEEILCNCAGSLTYKLPRPQRTTPCPGSNNKMGPYKGVQPIGYEDEV
ncbi:hypothetical protein TSMEX_011102 [Taenia solium]|eukprot:TsM_001077600 transcript=TsM_001077600 gene=TsM_001077600